MTLTKSDVQEQNLSGMTLDYSLVSEFPLIQRTEKYWNQVRGEKAIPLKKDLNPGDIRDILPFVQLYDILDNAAAYRARLMGTQIVSYFKTNPTGRVFDKSVEHPLIQRMLVVLNQVATKRCPLIARTDRSTIDNFEYASVETVYLPFSENGIEVSVVMAVTVIQVPEQDNRASHEISLPRHKLF